MKIYSLKIRKSSVIITCFALLFCAAIIYISVKGIRTVKTNAEALANAKTSPVCILIDPGHGGEDGGTASATGTLEKDLNLKIALNLRDMLKLSGFNVKMTRESDCDLSDKSLGTVRQRKISDLKNRVSLINGNTGGMVISIHQNFFEQPKYFGTQVFYSGNNPTSIDIAEKIRQSVTSMTQPDNTRELKDASSVYILKNTSCPAVIVECGFLSNPEEAEKLTTEDYQKALAFSICCGLIAYYK